MNKITLKSNQTYQRKPVKPSSKPFQASNSNDLQRSPKQTVPLKIPFKQQKQQRVFIRKPKSNSFRRMNKINQEAQMSKNGAEEIHTIRYMSPKVRQNRDQISKIASNPNLWRVNNQAFNTMPFVQSDTLIAKAPARISSMIENKNKYTNQIQQLKRENAKLREQNQHLKKLLESHGYKAEQMENIQNLLKGDRRQYRQREQLIQIINNLEQQKQHSLQNKLIRQQQKRLKQQQNIINRLNIQNTILQRIKNEYKIYKIDKQRQISNYKYKLTYLKTFKNQYNNDVKLQISSSSNSLLSYNSDSMLEADQEIVWKPHNHT